MFQQAIDVVAGNLLRKLDSTLSQKLELPPSIQEMKASLQLEQLRRRIALDERRQAEAEAKGQAQILRAESRLILDERRARLYDLEIQKAELEVERQRQRLESGDHLALPPGLDQPIKGALDFRANPSGISAEVHDEYLAWLDSLEMGKIVLILGKRGSGKTAFAFKLGEYVFAVHGCPVWLVGIPEEIAIYLPNWINIAQDVDQVDPGGFIIVDEAGLLYMAMRYQSDTNTQMRRLMGIARHRKQSLVFISQVAADVDKSVIRQADCSVFKQPNKMQPKNDRPEIREAAGLALKVFEPLSKDEKMRTAYIDDDDFTFVLQYDLPDYWREELSFAFANVSLGEGKNEETENAFEQADFKLKALEMRRNGLSQRQIAGALGVGRTRVRTALDGVEQGIERPS